LFGEDRFAGHDAGVHCANLVGRAEAIDLEEAFALCLDVRESLAFGRGEFERLRVFWCPLDGARFSLLEVFEVKCVRHCEPVLATLEDWWIILEAPCFRE